MRTCAYDFCRRTRNTTYQRDGESGEADLDYAMARYYASRSGRFITPDPGHIGANVGDPQSWNVYLYVSNDPVNATDPTGLIERSKRGFLSRLWSFLGGGGEEGGGAPLGLGPCFDVEFARDCVPAGSEEDFQLGSIGKHVPTRAERKEKLDLTNKFIENSLNLYPSCRKLLNITDGGVDAFMKVLKIVDTGKSGGLFIARAAYVVRPPGAPKENFVLSPSKYPIYLNDQAFGGSVSSMATLVFHEIWHNNGGGDRVHQDRARRDPFPFHPELRTACGGDDGIQ